MPKARKLPFHRNVVPDKLDLRDRMYEPSVRVRPSSRFDSLHEQRARVALPVLDQGDTSACTGFALSNVINFLLQQAGRKAETPVSPFMLYSMARRYDEFPDNNPVVTGEGTRPPRPAGKAVRVPPHREVRSAHGSEVKRDVGSSLRGGMKGWYKHGACAGRLWRTLEMPPPQRDPAHDWWPDAARRPLGAYFRVDHRSVADMHVALQEVGILYASAVCHDGWDEGSRLAPRARKGFCIPARKAKPSDGGHAFAIVGYDARGFLVLNSWAEGWGDGGLGTLRYEDWLDNAMDCWVAQLGVPTDQHFEIASARSLRVNAGKRVVVAADPVLRNREIAPFIIDVGRDGRLSNSGDFRTNPSDLQHLVGAQLDAARERWKLGKKPIDVALYAHGGLTSEETAAATAAQWIPALYEAHIFPIFLMWETDLWSTLENRLADALRRDGRTNNTAYAAGGVGEWLRSHWDERLERAFAASGSFLWGQMKHAAQQIADNAQSGINLLLALRHTVPGFTPDAVRLHLVGHSAGSIVQCQLIERLCDTGFAPESVSFLGAAARVDLFRATLLPALADGRVQRYFQFHLSEAVEEKDPTCRPLLGYDRSLLYLVARSFEGGARTAILGLERDFEAMALPSGAKRRITAYAAPSDVSACTTHGGFDDDALTRASVVACIKGRSPR
jgi:hypothetical protein